MSKYFNDKVHYVNVIDVQRFLTQMGIIVFNKESKKWNIIRVFRLMHQYSHSASELEPGDYFYGPKFIGDGLKPNIFKLSIYECENDYECKFEQVPYNESNLKKVRTDIIIEDFSWFKASTGKIQFKYNLNAVEILCIEYM